MFQVRNKVSDKIVDVYSVRDSRDGFAQFLVYDKKSWKWMSAKYFIPLKSRMSESSKIRA